MYWMLRKNEEFDLNEKTIHMGSYALGMDMKLKWCYRYNYIGFSCMCKMFKSTYIHCDVYTRSQIINYSNNIKRDHRCLVKNKCKESKHCKHNIF